MADFGKVSGGKGGKGGRGKRSRNFKSPIAKISGRKKGGAPDYECRFEVDVFHVPGAKGGVTYADALLGTFSEGRRNRNLMECLTGATAVQDVGDRVLANVGNTFHATFRLMAGDAFGQSQGALANAHPNSRFEVVVDGPSGDGIHWEGYETRNSAWGRTDQGVSLLFNMRGPSAEGNYWINQARSDGATCHLRVWFSGDDNPFNSTPKFSISP